MATHEIRIDRALPLAAEPHTGHNRWHPDIPPALECQPGDEVALDTRDTFDGAFHAGSSGKDVEEVDFGLVHPLTGPVHVAGAEPGDLLVAEILEVVPQPFGFTAQVPGFGFRRDVFADAYLVRWQIADGWATSEDLPGVRIAGAPFMGVIGVAPSRQLLEAATAREADLVARGGLALPPDPAGAVPGDPTIAAEGLRTVPPREYGGNVDIKQLTAGTRVLIPVFVDGALFSAGDAHFAQGDGEVCGTAIEMAASLAVRFELRKGQAAERGIRTLCYESDGPAPSALAPAPRRYFATTGMCITGEGRNEFEDLTLAARNAVDAMIEHLGYEYGYSRQQAYALCSVAVDLKVSQVVDLPNVIVSAFLPLDIFA
jgi:formamidase